MMSEMSTSSLNFTGNTTFNANCRPDRITKLIPPGPCECGGPISDGALFEFITNGVLLNLVGLFGLFGNIISMIILSRPQMKSSINYLLIGLARCDTVLIITSFLIFGLPAIYPYTGHLFNYKFIVYPRLVKFLYPLANAAQMVTVYLTLTVTMERYVAVCHPLRALSMCTYGRARIAVLCIIIASIAYNLPKFWEVNTKPEIHWKYNVTTYCVDPTELRLNEYYGTIYVHWMYFIFYYAVPFTALIIFNLSIYQQVRKANRDLKHLTHHERKEIGLATMLMCVVIVFLICNIIPLVTNIFEQFYDDIPLYLVQSGNLMVTINSSVNFIIYVIFGRKFKRIFLKLFCSAHFFDSPEYMDTTTCTSATNIVRDRVSVRRHRSSTISRNNNVNLSNGNSFPRQSMNMTVRSASPGPCVLYRARSPLRSPSHSQMSRTSSAHNGWENNNIAETALQ